MRRLTRWMALLPLVALAGSCEMYERAETKHRMKNRVGAVLEGARTDGGGSVTEQTAICRWWADKVLISDTWELGTASDAFDRWRRQGGIYDKLTTYEVTDVELLEDASPVTAIVSGAVNGKPFRMKVPDGRPIEWAK